MRSECINKDVKHHCYVMGLYLNLQHSFGRNLSLHLNYIIVNSCFSVQQANIIEVRAFIYVKNHHINSSCTHYSTLSIVSLQHKF